MKQTIKNYWTLLLGAIRFKIFVARANMLHMSTGKRYYVIPYPNSNFKLLVLCNDDIKRLKKMHIFKKNVSHLTIMESCLYFTNCGGKTEGKMDEVTKMQKFDSWIGHIKNKLGIK